MTRRRTQVCCVHADDYKGQDRTKLIKYISLLLLVILAGCSHSPIAELEDHYFQCTSVGAQGCDLIAEEIDRQYEIVAKREKHELRNCARGHATCLHGAEAREYWRKLDRAIF